MGPSLLLVSGWFPQYPPRLHPAVPGVPSLLTWRYPNSPGDSRSTHASADIMTSYYANMPIFGSGRPFFATGRLAEPLHFANPSTVVQGDRVTHLVYDVRR
jgi:hypothetical protein